LPTLRVALAQIAPTLGNRRHNHQLHLEQIAAARAEQADLIVFPELSLTGYFLRDMVSDVALNRAAPELQELIDAAGSASLVVGYAEESREHRFYNSAFFAEAGHILYNHRKVYLPNYGLFDERRYFAAGHRIRAFDSPRFGRIGLLVCEDFWHLSALCVLQAEDIDLLIVVSNSPARGIDGPEIRTAETYQRMCQTFAETLGAAVVFVDRVGFEDGLCFWGGSMLVAPDAQILARAPYFDPALIVAPLDYAELRRQRILTPLARDERLSVTLEELKRIQHQRYAD